MINKFKIISCIIVLVGLGLLIVGCEISEETEGQILEFKVKNQVEDEVINTADRVVTVKVAPGTDLENLEPEIKITNNHTITPESGEVQNFTDPVEYELKCNETQTSWDWTVQIIEDESVIYYENFLNEHDWEYFDPADDPDIHFEIDENNSYINETPSLFIKVPDGSQLAWPRWRKSIEISSEVEVLNLSAFVKTADDVSGPSGAYIELSYYDEEDERVGNERSPVGLEGDNDWTELTLDSSSVPSDAVSLNISFILQGHGKAWIDKVKLSR